MTECPALNTLQSNLDVETTENKSQLRLSTYTRTIGTSVDLSCVNEYSLIGESTVTCQSGGSWDYAIKPRCEPSSSGLSDSMIILIAALVGGLFLIILIVIVVTCLIRRKRRKRSAQEKFYRHLQEDSLPRGHKPGEMIQETQYRPPTYASAWPAISHSSIVGKREYPFRSPESDKSLHEGKSIWDNNDYFFGKADIPSESRSDNYMGSKQYIRGYSAENPKFVQPIVRQDINDNFRRRSYSDDMSIAPYRYSRQLSTIEPFQQKLNSNYGDRRAIPSAAEDDDVVVEVRIPSRYLKPKTDIPNRYNPVRDRHDYTKVLPTAADNTMAIPYPRSTNQIAQNNQTEVKQSLSKPPEKPKDVYQGLWPTRDDIKSLTEFNRRAILHNRDPFLWRPVDTNFGYDVWHDAKF